MKLPELTKRTSARPRAARWLAAGLLIGFFAIPSQAFAACSGSAGIQNDGTDLNANGLPDYLADNLPATVNWLLTPAAGSTSLDISVDQVRFALTCWDNGDVVPCNPPGNDGQAGDVGSTPLQYTGISTPGGSVAGDCGATFLSNTSGVVTFQLPESLLDQTGCTIEFPTQLVDYGIDARPDLITPAVAFNGTCAGGLENGSAAGSDTIQIVDPQIDVTKTGPVNAKVGDEITYTIGYTVVSDGDILDVCTGNDPLLGGDLGVFTAGVTRDFTYTVLVGDPNPLLNTATITCGLLGGSADTVSDDDDHSVDLIAPSIDVTKTGPVSAKVGDEITYTIGFTDTGTGTLGTCTGNDPLLGGDLGVFVDGVTRDFDYTVQVGDPDPLLNTATITCDVVGFTNKASDSDGHSVDLIGPSIDVTKTGPISAKVGDEITYTIGFTDTGTGTLGTCTGNDPLLGGDLGVFVDGVTRDFDYTVQVGDPDPLLNTATITCDVVGFDNKADDSDDHSVDLIAPSIDVTKTGPISAKVGDEITYTIGFTDTGTGTLGTCTGNDPLLGGDLGVFVDGVTRDFDYTVQVGDPNPLLNEVTITCDVAGFDNKAIDDDTWSVDVIAPSVDLTKVCRPDPVSVGGTIEWEITVDNDGDTDLACLVNDGDIFVDEPVTLAAGGSETLTASRTVEEGDAPTISNSATVDCAIEGFTNEVSDTDTADCEVDTSEAICRTPGFWGARGGDAGDASYHKGENYTLDAIGLGDPFEVCGSLVDNTDLGDPASAIEAICISKGDPMAKYIRMATSAALNCNLGDCGYIKGLLASCNLDCVAEDDDAMNACAAELGCFNEGGTYVDGQCEFGGTCHPIGSEGVGGSGQDCTFDSDKQDEDGTGCGVEGEECYREETCHDRALCPDGGDFCWESLGPASSPKKCNKARKTTPYIFDISGWPVTDAP